MKLLLEAGDDMGSREPGCVYDTVWKLCQRHGYLYEEKSGSRKVLATLDTYLEANEGPKLEGSFSIAEN